MKFGPLVRVATLSLTAIGVTTAAYATPITYQISGVASGKIGASSFTNALVTLTGKGDTANIVLVLGSAFAEPLTTATLTIQGIGTATITDPTEIFSSSIPATIPGLPTVPLVVIGRTDSPPALASITGIGFVGAAALLGYNLSTAFGPITTAPGGIGFPVLCGTPAHDPCLGTTLGTLAFTSDFSPTTQGTFSATPAAVPEPVTLVLLGAGLAAVGARRRSGPRKRAVAGFDRSRRPATAAIAL